MSWSTEHLRREAQLVRRLGEHGMAVFTGDTTVEVRRERVREAIARVGCSVICGRDAQGRPVTYAQAFERLYGQPYHANKPEDTCPT